MYVITVDNVNHALLVGTRMLQEQGVSVESRYGSTLEMPGPVTTRYAKPWERVVINPIRDANPFFHLFESLWILAGRQDVKFLTEFNKRMSEFSDDGEVFHAPYGYRLRHSHTRGREGCAVPVDQIRETIYHLKHSPQSRRAVMQIWDAEMDCNVRSKDIPCNDLVVFYRRGGKLTMTVYNRSNDMLWGAYGANAVQFSMLHEYVSAHTGIPMGEYYQVSNSFHVYTDGPGGDLWKRIQKGVRDFGYLFSTNPYSGSENLVRITDEDPEFFDMDLRMFFQRYDAHGIQKCMTGVYSSRFFLELVLPMLNIWLEYKGGNRSDLWAFIGQVGSDDWKQAASQWLVRRLNREYGTNLSRPTSDPRQKNPAR